MLARSTNVAYHAWTGVGQHTNATQTERAIASLYALLGCFDRSGGNRRFGKPPHRVVNALDLLDSRQKSKALGLEQRPLGPPAQGWVTARDTYRAILEGKPYRVRAMMAFGTNLPVAQADTTLAQATLAALEFCGCRVGQCESCAVRILSGRVMHLSGIEPEDPATCLACQAVPLDDIVLDA